MADASAIVPLTLRLTEQSAAAGHRGLLVLSGDRQWGCAAAGAVRAVLGRERALWLGVPSAAQPDALPAARATQYLGRELDLLVFDAHAGLDPDAFAAISGTLAGGGLLVLVVPELAAWPAWPDPEHRRLAVHPVFPEDVTGRFLAWFAERLATDDTVTRVEEGKPLPVLPAYVSVCTTAGATDDPDCLTADQADAVAAVVQTACGHRRRPLVVTADRGRGKSAALGIAAARLLGKGGAKRILVTSPRPEAADAVFNHAARLLPGAMLRRRQVSWEGGSLAYTAPDALLHVPRAADLLMVDEAAALPARLLEGLMTRYPRVVFATTVHGYEGSGRGFDLRFGHTLDRLAPGWRSLRMDTPVRWAPGDPLEAFVFRSLLLDAEPAPVPDNPRPQPPWHIERLDRDALIGDESLLRQVFGLLVAAHYRTTPLDLRHLLDGPNLQVWAVCWDRRVVATALVAAEGHFDAGLAHAVWAGRRRPRGHLLPQALALQAGAAEACRLGALRIIRLAVHPTVRRRGIGTALLERLLAAATADGLDLAGASFAATPGLVRFWSHAGFVTVRVGARRETGSGAHSVLVSRGTSGGGAALIGRVRKDFLRDFPLELGDFLGDLAPSLVEAVMTDALASAPVLSPGDLDRLKGFASQRRLFEPTRGALVRLVGAMLPHAGAWHAVSETGRKALVVRVLQARSWEASARVAGVAGRDALIAELRRATTALLAYSGYAGRVSLAGGGTPVEG